MRLILILMGRVHLIMAAWHDKQADKCLAAAQARKRAV